MTDELLALPRLLSLKETAKHLGVHETTVRGYIQSGKLGSVPMGRRRMVREDQLAAFIDAHTVNPD